MINSKHPTGNTKDYRGKLLILDFWATWCTPCVAAMPKMDSLQKKFESQVQILPVTYQPGEVVKELFRKSTKLKTVSLPLVTGDNTMRFLFPHKELPHYVWINNGGKVIAITGQEQVNADNIQKALSDATISLKLKKDVIKKYNREIPILFQNLGFKPEDLKFQSVLAGFKEGLSGRLDVVRNSDRKITKISLTNISLKSLFALAWSDEKRFFVNSMTLVEVKDTLKIITDASGEKAREWAKENAWCYELIIPEWASSKVFELMREDMGRYFPQYTIVVEKRMRRCLVLERTSTVDKLRSKGGEIKHSLSPSGGYMINCRIGLLTSELNHFLQNLHIPVIDATGYTDRIDMQLDANITNMESLRKALQEYDLDLIEKNYEVEVLVIKDKY